MAVAYVNCRLSHKEFYITEDLYSRIRKGSHTYLICPWCKKKFLVDMEDKKLPENQKNLVLEGLH